MINYSATVNVRFDGWPHPVAWPVDAGASPPSQRSPAKCDPPQTQAPPQSTFACEV